MRYLYAVKRGNFELVQKAFSVFNYKTKLIFSPAHDLEFLEFSTVWSRLSYHAITKCACMWIHLSLSSDAYIAFFGYWNFIVNHILIKVSRY